ncbi:unnamed protein product [Somion occarium]|uniref:Major facilitator superfamily (MFS) profile domain-containing protein n=1 Tax=Somion occarium TaxID=3059160 RepID=A0ABP1CR06_9APHY
MLANNRQSESQVEATSDEVPCEKFDDMSKARVGAILLSLGLCVFLYAIEETIVATAVSDIGLGVHATGSLTWITTSYLLTTTVIQPITGRLSDVFGAKRMLLVEVWVFIIGNVIAGAAKTLPQLVAGRLISGVGGAGLLALSTIMVSQLTHERQRGSYLNLINVVFIFADSIGPIIGGIFARSGNWRWIFLFNAPFGPIISLALIFLVHLRHSKSQSLNWRFAMRNLDVMGMMMLITSLTLLIISLNLGGEARPWKSPTIIGLFAGAGGAFLAFIFAERSATHPVVPISLFTDLKWRNVPIMTIVRCLLFFHLFATTFYVPIFLQVVGQPEVVAAALVIPFLLMAAIASILAGYIAQRTGWTRPLFLIALVILPIGEGLMSTLNASSHIGQIVGYSLICGFGFGGGTQLSLVIAQIGLPEDLLPTVTALISATPNLGGVLGVGIIGTVINNTFRMRLSSLVGANTIPHINDAVAASKDPRLGNYVRIAYVQAFQLGFQILAGIAVLQFVLCLGLRRVVLKGGKDLKEKPVIRTDVEAIEMAAAGAKRPASPVVCESLEAWKDEVGKSEIEVIVRS